MHTKIMFGFPVEVGEKHWANDKGGGVGTARGHGGFEHW